LGAEESAANATPASIKTSANVSKMRITRF
jgi:hypothetical protein